jgi:hypothetical protein
VSRFAISALPLLAALFALAHRPPWSKPTHLQNIVRP